MDNYIREIDALCSLFNDDSCIIDYGDYYTYKDGVHNFSFAFEVLQPIVEKLNLIKFVDIQGRVRYCKKAYCEKYKTEFENYIKYTNDEIESLKMRLSKRLETLQTLESNLVDLNNLLK